MPGNDAGAQRLKARVEPIQVVLGERAGSDQAHLSFDHIEDLRQLVETGPPQEMTYARQDPRIVAEFAVALPLQPGVGIAAQILLEPLLRGGIHRPEFPDFDETPVLARAELGVERRALADRPDPKRQGRDDRHPDDEQRQRNQLVE
jgi:hypothetical protein